MENFWKRRRKRKKKEIGEWDNNRIFKDKIIRDIRALFEQGKEDYYKSKIVSGFWNNNYIEYESKSGKSNNLLLEKYLNKIKPNLKGIIIDLQRSNTWQIQLTIAVNFISSKDTEEDNLIYSTSFNKKSTSHNNANEVVNELFQSLCSKITPI